MEAGIASLDKLSAGEFKFSKTQEIIMNISRKLGILVFCGVPAIIGGGIVYAIFGSYTPVTIYELLLLTAAGVFLSR